MKFVIIVSLGLWCLPGLSNQTNHENIPAGGVSLVFVFDTTSSMSDDLQQAKLGATQILNTTRALPNQPLYNYILVPFNDPCEYFLLKSGYYLPVCWMVHVITD